MHILYVIIELTKLVLVNELSYSYITELSNLDKFLIIFIK